jgi:hypothetical protein
MIAERSFADGVDAEIEIPLGQCRKTQSGRLAPVPHNFAA